MAPLLLYTDDIKEMVKKRNNLTKEISILSKPMCVSLKNSSCHLINLTEKSIESNEKVKETIQARNGLTKKTNELSMISNFYLSMYT